MSAPRSTRHVPLYRWLAVLLLLAFFAQVVMASPRQSLTADEPVSIGAGYSYWTTGDWRLQAPVAHPPAIHLLITWPLLLRPRLDVTTQPGWQEANLTRFVRQVVPRLGPLEATAFAARAPNMLLAMLLAALVFRWTSEWFGERAGLVALALLAFDPNVIAHAQLATTDMGVTLFCFAAFYGLQRMLQRPTWRACLLCGGAAGLATAAKTSGALILAALTAAVLAYRALDTHLPLTTRARRAAGQVAAIMALAAGVVWAVYRFELRPLAPAGWPIPAASYWQVITAQQAHAVGGQRAFLMGRLSEQGWWVYYPVVLAVKTPLPTLILFVSALAAAFVRVTRRHIGTDTWRRAALLATFPVLFAAAALWGRINLGYRLLLPMLPFVFVFIGWQVAGRRTQVTAGATHPSWLITHYASRFTFCALLAWYVINAVLIFPYHLAYFNELVGGPEGGYRWLVDSNLDWGQEFLELNRYVKARGIAQVNVSQYTYIDAALYSPNVTPIAPSHQAPPVLPARFEPAPGVYAIGATMLQGVMLADPDNYEWFRHQTPTARLGHALFVYDVPARPQGPRWVAQCAAPVAPLAPEVIAEGFGRHDLRLVSFDCLQSWLFPSGKQSPGWYVLPRDVLRDGFIEQRLADARLSYEQRTNRESPAFAIYEHASASMDSICTAAAQKLDGPLNFMGYRASTVARPGSIIEVETCWRVTTRPERPLSLMLHLVSPDGSHLVADGLGVPVDQWEAGDIIVQRHRIELPAGTPQGQYQLLAGAYWLDTLQRWPVAAGGDTLKLPLLRVER